MRMYRLGLSFLRSGEATKVVRWQQSRKMKRRSSVIETVTLPELDLLMVQCCWQSPQCSLASKAIRLI